MLQLNLMVLTLIGQIPKNEAAFTFSMYNYWHWEHFVLDHEVWFIQKSGNGDRSHTSKVKPTAELKVQREVASTFVVCSWLSLAISAFLLVPSFSK